MAFEHRLIAGNADVVRVLEDALEEARKGELVGVIVCGITEGSGVVTAPWGPPWWEEI